jgi:hypothetical protein
LLLYKKIKLKLKERTLGYPLFVPLASPSVLYRTSKMA